MLTTIIMIMYHLLSAFIAIVLIREIIKTKDAQEAVLFSIILIPFVLRVLHVK